MDRINNLIGTQWNPKGADKAERREVEVEVIPAGLPLDPSHPVQPDLSDPREFLDNFTSGENTCQSTGVLKVA